MFSNLDKQKKEHFIKFLFDLEKTDISNDKKVISIIDEVSSILEDERSK